MLADIQLDLVAGKLILTLPVTTLVQSVPEKDKYVYPTLTAREKEVLALLKAGDYNKEIASNLNITERTAVFHVSNILHKFGVKNRHDLITIVGPTQHIEKKFPTLKELVPKNRKINKDTEVFPLSGHAVGRP